LANNKKFERLERRVDGFYAMCEKIALRTLLFGCFMLELVRSFVWLFR